ncbi:hypothetical protein IE53DRAFT_170243 [Violaceomyces palustris]|uniref:Uncharacterized protein n=1 Tax=Violaceomyces palustris TaxID=1673888 RepID=A0ACD0NSX3_9BASI|nr:hypothetical protein IE53DRAFT_170243 [Violaceomyces palustris]
MIRDVQSSLSAGWSPDPLTRKLEGSSALPSSLGPSKGGEHSRMEEEEGFVPSSLQKQFARTMSCYLSSPLFPCFIPMFLIRLMMISCLTRWMHGEGCWLVSSCPEREREVGCPRHEPNTHVLHVCMKGEI